MISVCFISCIQNTAVGSTTPADTTAPSTPGDTEGNEVTKPAYTSMGDASELTTAPGTIAPETTVPETTLPETTVPETTVSETTKLVTTKPETTKPVTTAKPVTTENVQNPIVPNAKKTLSIAGVSASEFRIVYSDNDMHGAKIFALRLKQLIKSVFGVDVTVVSDNASAISNEIVIGNTNRGVQGASNIAYTLACSEGKLYFASPYSVGYEYMFNYFEELYTDTKGAFAYKNSYYFSKKLSSVLDYGSENVLQKTGNVRIMYNNIWVHDVASAPQALRAKQLVDVYRDYAPDILCLQEWDGNMRAYTTPMIISIGYSQVEFAENSTPSVNICTPIFYNAKTIKIVNSGFWFLDGNVYNSTGVAWALVEIKATKKQFIVATTHYAWVEDSDQANALRIRNANDTVNCISTLINRYNVPVVIGGDFNTSSSGEPYKILTNKGFTHVKDLAQNKTGVGTHHDYPTFDLSTGVCNNYFYPLPNSASALDHAFVYNQGKMKFNTYAIIEDYLALASTDHCPILVDITLK